MNKNILNLFKYVFTRIGIICFLFLFLFFIFVDLDTLSLRIKMRDANRAIPDYSAMILYAKHKNKSPVKWDKYRKYFELVIRNKFDNVISMNLLGYVYFQMGQEDKALKVLKDAYETSYGGFFWTNYNLAVVSYKKKMYPQAEECLKRVIDAEHLPTIALMRNAIVYRQIFANQQFVYNLDKEIDEAIGSAYILLVATMINLGKYEQALFISSLALQKSQLGLKEAFYYYAGVASFRLGHADKALILLQKSLEIEKNNPWTYLYLSQIYEIMGQKAHSTQLFELYQTLKNFKKDQFPYDEKVELRFF